jgi:hypothetical protein
MTLSDEPGLYFPGGSASASRTSSSSPTTEPSTSARGSASPDLPRVSGSPESARPVPRRDARRRAEGARRRAARPADDPLHARPPDRALSLPFLVHDPGLALRRGAAASAPRCGSASPRSARARARGPRESLERRGLARRRPTTRPAESQSHAPAARARRGVRRARPGSRRRVLRGP